MLVLGIETSCDETAIGLVNSDGDVLGEAIFSQIEIHRQHGGVVPELASRDHLKKLAPLLEEALPPGALPRIDAIAYTQGPGLIGALMTGAVFAHSLAWAINKPAIGVHHMEAHLMVCGLQQKDLSLPYLSLLVSGGHTQLVEVRGLGDYHLWGETLDDAAGESFDKVARMLGLDYPGGPEIERIAQQGQAGKFEFPRPMSQHKTLDFSFSGLKTKVLRTLEGQPADPQLFADVALEFQSAVIDSLMTKCVQALKQTGLKQLVIAGGVAANSYLRERAQLLQEDGVRVFYPPKELCTDNGTMIAYTGLLHLEAGATPDALPLVRARFPMDEIGSAFSH